MTAPDTVPSFDAGIDLDARRGLVIAASLNGIDFVEVLATERTLLVRMLKDLGNSAPRGSAVQITGGVRADPAINPVRVGWAYPASVILAGPLPSGVTTNDQDLVRSALLPGEAPRVLVVRTSSSGDSSPYRVHLLGPKRVQPPDGFDPVLSEMPFSFRAGTEESDPLARQPDDVPAPEPSPVTDYLARDAEALRTRLLDRFAAVVPGWDDRNPADAAVMLLEIFAALGDRLAYWQDAAAVEAFLGTARRRTSIRRHARLLGYDLHEGCSARAWLAFATDTSLTLPEHTAVTDVAATPGTTAAQAAAAGAVVFETCVAASLTPARTAIELYAWGDPEHVLPAGSRSAYLVVPAGTPGPALRRGDVLILADCPRPAAPTSPSRPETATQRFERAQEGDPLRRFPVRLDENPVERTDVLPIRRSNDPCRPDEPARTVLEIHWYAEDALPGMVQVSETWPDGTPVVRAVALANLVPADDGAAIAAEPLLPARPPGPGLPFRPRLRSGAPAWVDPGWIRTAGTGSADSVAGPDDNRPAATLQRPDPLAAVPALELTDGRRTWSARRDLLASGREDAHVVVEPDGRGGATLRFGDRINGRVPGSQTPIAAQYRIGGGTRGNVAAGRLVHPLAGTPRGPQAATDPFGGAVVSVWNPLPALGGTDPEDAESARRLAPAGLRRQERAVTSADYAAAAAEVDGVQRSAARRRWNGSWYVQEAAVDPLGAEELTDRLAQAVRTRLELRRMAGTDVTVRGPAYAALLIAITVQVRDGLARLSVEERVRDALSSRALSGGRLGFFHPDRLTFGQPVDLSDLIVAVLAVAGVNFVEVTRFGRLDDTDEAAAASLRQARITVHPLEVARCDSDPDRPEAGRVKLTMNGGS